MEEAPHKEAQPKKVADPLVMAYVVFAGFALLLLLPAFFFSLGPLISTRGRAWEYDLVRELFITSVVTFILVVVLPLVAAYNLSRGTKWSRASVMAAAVTSALVGLLFLIGGITRGWPVSIIITAPSWALSVYAFWSLRRKAAV
jgi:hypothetical protein